MAKTIRILGWAFLAVTLHVGQVRAQGTGPAMPDPREQPVAPVQPPVPAGGTSLLAVEFDGGVQGAPDGRPLSGVQEQTSGPSLGARNFLVPSLSVASQMTTSSSNSGLSQPTASSYVLGTLDLNHVSDRSELLLHYAGGGVFSTYLNSAIQDLEFTYTFKWQRFSLLAGEDVSFLSESPFGFGGVGGLGFLNGASLSGALGFLLPILSPNQTIPTIIVPRLSNTAVAQMEYRLSPRSSWTAAGSFGTLNFLGVHYINSNQALFQAGYNYLLSPKSSMAVIYRYNDFRFSHLPQAITDQVVQLAYSRSVTGKLSFQLAAGPSIETLRGVFTGSGNQISWAADSSLNYQMGRTSVLIAYDHGVTGGSGVLAGARTSQVAATINRKLNARWQGSTTMGYATNSSLVPSINILNQQNYNSWFAVARFDHQFRPGTAFFMSYGARLQASNATGCGTPSCAGNFISHDFSVGFNFSLRPRMFQ